jgi:hypothetical protein
MPNSQAVCAYRVTAKGGQTIAALAAALAAVPLDLEFLVQVVGALPVSDVTVVGGQTATRTIALQFAPGVPATGTPVFRDKGSPTGAIVLPLDNPGSNGDYARAPVLLFPPTTPGTPPPEGIATMVPRMSVIDAIVVAPGSGYSGASKAVFVGGELDPLGTPAAGTPTISGGQITGITFTNNGLGYQSFPQIQIVDPGGGTGALVFGGLSVQSLKQYNPGNYQLLPLATFTSYFQSSWPDTADQVSIFRNFMIRSLMESVRSPIVQVDPVIS